MNKKPMSQKERLAAQNRTWVVVHVDIPVKKRLRVTAKKKGTSMDRFFESLIRKAV